MLPTFTFSRISVVAAALVRLVWTVKLLNSSGVSRRAANVGFVGGVEAHDASRQAPARMHSVIVFTLRSGDEINELNRPEA